MSIKNTTLQQLSFLKHFLFSKNVANFCLQLKFRQNIRKPDKNVWQKPRLCCSLKKKVEKFQFSNLNCPLPTALCIDSWWSKIQVCIEAGGGTTSRWVKYNFEKMGSLSRSKQSAQSFSNKILRRYRFRICAGLELMNFLHFLFRSLKEAQKFIDGLML